MGQLIDGIWQGCWQDALGNDKKYIRQNNSFYSQIGSKEFPVESGRYHLFASYSCPWAHRALIFMKLKKLEEIITVSIVEPEFFEDGWVTGEFGDPFYNTKFLHEIYTKVDHHFSGQVTLPVLWDKRREKIVSNDSSEIIRMFNCVFNEMTSNCDDYYPKFLRSKIDDLNIAIYKNINNGVYQAGLAKTQEEYEKHVVNLFNSLECMEQILSKNRYLLGSEITEADWRLFVTLIRFDLVYYCLFKCNLNSIASYPNLSNYIKELYQIPGISKTLNFNHIKRHYYKSYSFINVNKIIPIGPEIDFSSPHNRDKLK